MKFSKRVFAVATIASRLEAGERASGEFVNEVCTPDYFVRRALDLLEAAEELVMNVVASEERAEHANATRAP
jgi:hypothetical protein